MSNEPLSVKCYYRDSAYRCVSGMLYDADGNAALVEGTGVYCPACEGKSVILTSKGRDLLQFLMKFARPMLRDIMEELFEERER